MRYKEVYKGYSPWGGIQHSYIIGKGLKLVMTAGHGGYMATKSFADKYLSDACKKRALKYQGYLCFEEDCDYAIISYDLLNTKYADKMKGEKTSKEEYEKNLLKSLSSWNPDYLIEKGIKPLEA